MSMSLNTTTTCQGWKCDEVATQTRPDFNCCDWHARNFDHAQRRQADEARYAAMGIDFAAEAAAERALESRVS